MFLRWSKVKGKRGSLLCVSFVAALRIEGKPRQIYIGHLGSIREADLGHAP
jgi:hypothetical protein